MVLKTPSPELDRPILWTNRLWNGDPNGDITLEFEGYTWKVKKDIVSAKLPWIKAALIKTEPVSTRHISLPSFFTYAEIYFLAERFGIDQLKLRMVKCVEELSYHVLSLAEAHCAHCPLSRVDVDWEEGQHLASFLDAVLLVEGQPWSARIAKAMYDAGDRLKPRLVRLPAFCDFVERFLVGRNFARAIGVDVL
ncbi:hypothetical protein C8A00DRAFT_11339 [Chaetomidium leptoderma]|uniref:Uncharacterized protein n=1 Tax=Chaetomidium leptoderma TaxID=669021 RepID=A0AAN6VU67_9PEZI|nr:hypothetical protein C8A00DRAFT_11339 [Chaetomidium leptoderma]